MSVDDHRWCWPGDSDDLERHRELDGTAFTPPVGAFTMDRRAVAERAGVIRPELVVPIHYNASEAREADSPLSGAT